MQSVGISPVVVLALLFILPNWCRAWDYGNGRHGSYVLTTNATIEQLYQIVRLTNDPAQYNPADSNAIPNFQNLIITNGATLTANPWNGTTGGRISLKVQGTLSVATNSTISANAIGYRGGGWVYLGGFSAGIQGESYAGIEATNTSANYGGGGGADTIGGGGGGGYATAGIQGTLNNGSHGGAGGATYGTPSLDTVYLGSGGGGGNYNNAANGGGVIILNVGFLDAAGKIAANGGDAPGYGGAGSGGSVLLNVGSAFLYTNSVTAVGGAPGPFGGSQGGGAGGVGRVALYYAENFTGATTPTAYTSQDTNADSIIITRQSSSQTNFLGDTITFTVDFTTISPHTSQWYFNGAVITGATNSSFTMETLALTNQGDYWFTISNAVIAISSSPIHLTVLDTNNPFGDGIPNWWKSQYGLSLTDPTLGTNYPPGDKLTYQEKFLYGLNPLTIDTDGDGINDYDEIFVYHSNPLSANTAGDGISDSWKVQYGLNPTIAYANLEAGFDGVTYMQIYQYDLTHTNQLNPNTPFAVGSGLSSYEILNNGQHTNRFYYDHGDRLLGLESSRGISIGYQYDGNGNLVHQAVLSRASETNGLPVLWLWLNGLSNQPGIAYQSASGNGWDNYQEWLAGLNASSNSVPGLTVNPGTNIGALTEAFTPTNFVMAAGNLDGVAGDEIVVGADGNPGTNNNSLFILTQTATNWSTQAISVGSFGITSIAIGQPTNRPSAGIYVGLRSTNGTGQITEFVNSGGIWQSNVIAVSTNPASFLVGVRSNKDVLASLSTTNGPDGALWSLTCSNGLWNQQLVSTNTSRTGGITAAAGAPLAAGTAGIRLLDSGNIEVDDSGLTMSNGSVVVLPSVPGVQSIQWPGCDLTAGALAASATNAMSVFRALVDDRLSTGRVEPGDDLVIFEYDLQTNTWSTNLFARVPITTENPAQAYGIASVNFVPNQPNCLFSAEPDGQIFTWSSASATNVVRQLFSPDYAGQAWQGLRAVGMPGIGEGLAGLLVSPPDQSTCSVVFWAPQAALPVPKPSLLETAPYAAVIPTNIVLGENAGLIVRLWHAEGVASTPSLQYQILGTTSWSNATLTTLDGLPYSTSLRVAALPTGSDHRVVWSALTDLGSNVATNVLLRARAQDFMLTGDWSLATPFEVNTFPPTTLSVGPPQILSNGGFGFSVNGGVLGKSYTVLASTNLIDWLPISDYVFTNPPVMIIDPNATNFPRRFYEIGP